YGDAGRDRAHSRRGAGRAAELRGGQGPAPAHRARAHAPHRRHRRRAPPACLDRERTMIAPYAGPTPRLDPTAFLVRTASVIGDVVIGPESSIWFGAVVRGDIHPIRIGARTNVQDNAVLHVVGGKHGTMLGDGVTIGHNAIVHGCTIEDGALVGMG